MGRLEIGIEFIFPRVIHMKQLMQCCTEADGTQLQEIISSLQYRPNTFLALDAGNSSISIGFQNSPQIDGENKNS